MTTAPGALRHPSWKAWPWKWSGRARVLRSFHCRGQRPPRSHHWWPFNIQEAAGTKGLTVPIRSPPRPNDLTGRFGSVSARQPDPIWPRFPAVASFWDKAAVEPAKMKAPAVTYAPLTRVEGFTERGFPSVPSLEQSLAEVFGAKVARMDQKPVPPGRHD